MAEGGRRHKLNSGGIQPGGLKDGKVTVLNGWVPRRSRHAARRAAQQVGATWSIEFGEGK